MKKKDLQELRTKKEMELFSLIRDKQKELAKVKLELHLGKLKNVRGARDLRRSLAQINTIIRESGTSRIGSTERSKS